MHTHSDNTIFLDRITLRIRDRSLFRDTTWKIEPGHHWAVIGPNGAGKTTLVGALTGRVPVVGGKIHWPGALLKKDAIGYVSWEGQRRVVLRDADLDEARFFSKQPQDALRVRDLFPRPPALDGIDAPLAPLWDRCLRSLSIGERLLVFLVHAIRKRPRLLVLDEPFTGLDAPNRRWLRQVLENRMADHTQLILVTHRTEEILPGVTHVLGVKDGRVCCCGFRSEVLGDAVLKNLYGRPAHRFPARRRPRAPVGRSEAWIEMRRVYVRYGRRVVLRDVDWKICEGQHWAVVGANGSGKSTLMQLIAGDHPQAYANEIYWLGRRRGSGETIWQIKRDIGVVSAEFQLYYHRPIRVLAVVRSGFFDTVGLYHQANARQRKTAAYWMRQLRLESLADRPFDTLSAGEQRSVLLARALVKAPRLLILDEPCQGLDRTARTRFLAILDRVGQNQTAQLLYVTHLPGELPACITHRLRLVPTAQGGVTAETRRVRPNALRTG
jgi:molybdate transport system ATP-binding protein